MPPTFDASDSSDSDSHSSSESKQSKPQASAPPPHPPSKPKPEPGLKKRDRDPDAPLQNGRGKRPTVAEVRKLKAERQQFLESKPLIEDSMAWLVSFRDSTPPLLRVMQKQADDFGAGVALINKTVASLTESVRASLARLRELEHEQVQAVVQHEKHVAALLSKYEALASSMASAAPFDFAFHPDSRHASAGGAEDLGMVDSPLPVTPR
jgi:hypothetical protein